MKAPGHEYKIIRTPSGVWHVIRAADGKVLYEYEGTHRGFLNARNRHMALALGVSIKTARRMGN